MIRKQKVFASLTEFLQALGCLFTFMVLAGGIWLIARLSIAAIGKVSQ